MEQLLRRAAEQGAVEEVIIAAVELVRDGVVVTASETALVAEVVVDRMRVLTTILEAIGK